MVLSSCGGGAAQALPWPPKRSGSGPVPSVSRMCRGNSRCRRLIDDPDAEGQSSGGERVPTAMPPAVRASPRRSLSSALRWLDLHGRYGSGADAPRTHASGPDRLVRRFRWYAVFGAGGANGDSGKTSSCAANERVKHPPGADPQRDKRFVAEFKVHFRSSEARCLTVPEASRADVCESCSRER